MQGQTDAQGQTDVQGQTHEQEQTGHRNRLIDIQGQTVCKDRLMYRDSLVCRDRHMYRDILVSEEKRNWDVHWLCLPGGSVCLGIYVKTAVEDEEDDPTEGKAKSWKAPWYSRLN